MNEIVEFLKTRRSVIIKNIVNSPETPAASDSTVLLHLPEKVQSMPPDNIQDIVDEETDKQNKSDGRVIT